MTDKFNIGSFGEVQAASYLSIKGYRIVERNWRYHRLEIDLIAWESDVLVFVEVKTRSSKSYYAPERSIDRSKWENLARAAGIYMQRCGHEWEIRFDVVSVVVYPDMDYTIEHYSDVFFPGRY